ncbi:hypothetical protein BDZ91DRAFT_847758 [Kalaharituber pfeilii]|nr:hypothetical protein BDZ91DRAFT_847758 [Kalaharituber pfeilii]
MKPEDTLIEGIIKDGKIDLDSWPLIRKTFLERIDHIANHSFPINPVPTASNNAEKQAREQEKKGTVVEPSTTDDSAMDITDSTEPTPVPSVPTESPAGSLAPGILDTIASIKETLSTTFSSAPPYTVQRLAELIQKPNEHYRSLPKFLRAVQRVISVSSATDQFPLPSSTELPVTGMLNVLGSDESLGGALLTPISWLRHDSLSTDGEYETRMNGVTQGELLRQEQEQGSQTATASNGDTNEERLQVHAQGPPTLGPEDLGPQPPGVAFPDLRELPSNSAPGTQGKRDEMIDVTMTDDASPKTPQLPSENDDMMDVDNDKVTEGKEPSSTEVVQEPHSAEETTAGNTSA